MKPEEPPVNNPRAILGLLGSLHETIERLKVGEGLEYPPTYDMRRISDAVVDWYMVVGQKERPLPAHEQIANILSDHSQAVHTLREARNRVHFTDVHVEVKRMVAEAFAMHRSLDAAGVVAKRLQAEKESMAVELNAVRAKLADRDAVAHKLAATEASLKELTAKPNTADPVPMCALELERIHDLVRELVDAAGRPIDGSAFQKVAALKALYGKVVNAFNDVRDKYRVYRLGAVSETSRLEGENTGLKALVESRKKEHEEFRAKALAERASLIEETIRLRGEHTTGIINLSKEISKLKQDNQQITALKDTIAADYAILYEDRVRVLVQATDHGYRQASGPVVLSDFVHHLLTDLAAAHQSILRLQKP